MRDKQLILIVDDAREIARSIGLRMRAAGYDVMTACNGELGLKAAVESSPDAIICDIRMPVMDGFTMLARLRELGEVGAIPTIVLSANIAEQARAQALQLGARFFYRKTF